MRCRLDLWVRKILWSRKGILLQYSCLENSVDRGVWQATGHGVAKSWTRLSDFTFFISIVPFGEGRGSPLRCSCLEMPWTEGPGGLWSMGLQRVRHDWATNTHTHTMINMLSQHFSTQSKTNLLSHEKMSIVKKKPHKYY